MIRIKASYSTIEEKDKLLKELKERFHIIKIRNENKEGPYRKICISLENK